MFLIPIAASVLLSLQVPPADVSWGNPQAGVRLGLSVQSKPDGPPVLNCYLKNESDVLAVYRPEDKRHASAVPEYMFKGKNGAWFVTPPSSYPGFWDGPDYRQVNVPAHMTVLVNSSRFWFAIGSGTYTITATYSSIRRYSVGHDERKEPVQYDSGEATIVLSPDHIQPATPAGIG